MTVKEIIETYLKENGYDGLAGDECGCSLKDLMCCESSPYECVPGHEIKCDEDEYGHGYVICPGKRGDAMAELKRLHPNVNPRFVMFAMSNGLSPDDQLSSMRDEDGRANMTDFICWSSGMIERFRKINGIKGEMSNEQYEAYDEWLWMVTR